MTYSILGLLHLIIAVWAVFNILGSSASGISKILWTLFVVIFPVVGLIIWFLAGPKSSGRIA